MCMGTMVMGGIRRIVIGARDAHGGAMHLIEHSTFLRNKNISISWMPQQYGDIQRAFQTLKELLYSTDNERLERILIDFSVHNAKGVEAAKELIQEGLFEGKQPALYSAEEIFDRLMAIMER